VLISFLLEPQAEKNTAAAKRNNESFTLIKIFNCYSFMIYIYFDLTAKNKIAATAEAVITAAGKIIDSRRLSPGGIL